jgi:phytoene/squalene synthetase
MDLYDSVAQESSRLLTKRYSSSFGMASSLFDTSIRQDIYNIYGLVRLADEIVDTYRGDNAAMLLNDLEQDTYAAVASEYSTNLTVHAFQLTARKYGIDKELVAPFFTSMRTDLTAKRFNRKQYQTYIHGSAEVVGLMCLRVFCGGNQAQYEALRPGAMSLGAAYQKVNFLRDIAEDWEQLERYYFPIGSYDSFDEPTKAAIIDDIAADFGRAEPAIRQLPTSARRAVTLSYRYYSKLLQQLRRTPAARIKQQRVRISKARKLALLGVTMAGKK